MPDPKPRQHVRGRGASGNPANRFEPLAYEPDPGENREPVRTRFYRDASKTVIASNNSPDVGFDASINPYRGCEHGCSYCYARPTHEYLGFSAGLDFESRILVKEDAPELLVRELRRPGWKPRVIGMSGVTDPYQPIERRLKLTRGCLEVLLRFRNPVAIVTKNRLVTRDADLLAALARHDAAAVYLSVTSLRRDLVRSMEPRTSGPDQRLRAIATLAQAGIPTGVLVAPVIPGLNDEEIPAILEAAAQAGARFAGIIVLRLPHGVAGLFTEWLETHVPERKGRILNRVRDLRGDKLNDPRYGTRMTGEGAFARQISDLFAMARRKAGLAERAPALSTASFRRTGDGQMDFFAPGLPDGPAA